MNTPSAFVVFTMVGVLGGCGRPVGKERLGHVEQRIFGGVVDPGDPAVVALTDEDGYYFCSGTLVDPVHVVTAAHCLNESAPAYVFTCPDNNDGGGDDCFLDVSSSAYHPQYDGDSSAHDIGVVTLDSPAGIAPIPVAALPLPMSAIGTDVRLVGYGDDENGGTGVKRQATHSIDEMDASTFIMWGTPNHCYGDSGGPAFWPAGANNEGLVGVTSAGTADACDQGGVDTRVSDNFDWLADQGVVGDPNFGPTDNGTTTSSASSSSGSSGSSGSTSSGGDPGGGTGGSFDPGSSGSSGLGDESPSADPGTNHEASDDSGCQIGAGRGSGSASSWTALAFACLALGVGKRRRRA